METRKLRVAVQRQHVDSKEKEKEFQRAYGLLRDPDEKGRSRTRDVLVAAQVLALQGQVHTLQKQINEQESIPTTTIE